MERKLKIITDNGCDLDSSWLNENDIHVVKFGLVVDDVEYEGETGKEMETLRFYEKLVGGAMPKTNQINPYVAKKHIEPFLKEGYDILYVSFSSGLSGSFSSVRVACLELKEKYKDQNIYVIDTLCASLGQGLYLDYIIRYARTAETFKQLVEYGEDLKLKIVHDFTVNDLFHLKRGGRVTATSAIIGTLLSIKPILHVDDNGKLIPIHKVRGRMASIKKLFDMFKENNDVNDDDPIFISHANCYEDVIKLEKMLKEIKPNNRIYINYIGPIIGAHAGQGTLALFYKGKSRNV